MYHCQCAYITLSLPSSHSPMLGWNSATASSVSPPDVKDPFCSVRYLTPACCGHDTFTLPPNRGKNNGLALQRVPVMKAGVLLIHTVALSAWLPKEQQSRRD